jgi:ABC-type lipoprotein export system ATPase subunit
MTRVVEAFGVSRMFEVGDSEVWALRDVDLVVNKGEFVALIGRSGSGKTTLLNLIAGLDRPTQGRIAVDGVDLSELNGNGLNELRRHKIGFVFQSFGLLPLLSAYENVEIALRIGGAGIRERGKRAREVLEMVGLTQRMSHRPYELSGGEQQRVAIARALANNAPIILADEPTGELDSTTAVQIFNLLKEVVDRHGVTVITSTHDRTVMEMAYRVVEMKDGRIVASGEESELLRFTTHRDVGVFRKARAGEPQQAVAVAAPEDEDEYAEEPPSEPLELPPPPRDDDDAATRWARPGR